MRGPDSERAPAPSRRGAPSTPPAPAPSRALWLVLVALVIVPALVLFVALRSVPEERPRVSTASAEPAPTALAQAWLRGRVTTEDGEPALGARVSLLGPGPTFAPLREAEVDGAGRFSFPDAKGARLARLVAAREGGIAASEELVVSDAMADVVLTLEAARELHGKATYDDGAIAAGVTVEITDAPAWARRKTTTDDQGAYSLSIVPVRARALRATVKGAATVELTLTGAAPDELADLKLTRETEIEGTVLDPDDKPVRRAEIVACDGKEDGARTRTDKEGKFQLARRFSACSLVASHDEYAPSDPVAASAPSVVLHLKAGGGISGTVVDDKGRPVVEGYVGVESFTPSGAGASVRSGSIKSYKDPAGAFALDRLAPGSYVLSYGAVGHAAQRSTPIDVRAGEVRRDVRLALFAGGSVEGVVTDGEGKPLADVSVAFDSTSSSRRPEPAVKTGADGRYHLGGAPPERFSVRFDKEGRRSRVLSGLQIQAGGSLTRDVSLPPLEDGGASSEGSGIGAVLIQTRHGVVFVAIHPGSPAERAGLRKDDVLTAVDGRDARGHSVADLTQALRGDAGTKVRVAVARPDGGNLEVTVERAEILR
ncbi:MAG: carboxypeptidase regulatory-like domain-containing protein [Polyangiaceae bacterium]|nr:carboxypeptidase regulatory-like domain-containing protein [Polyangiaceae bacterium]